MKIGSLFDGSGGFPLAATICGIEPVWAAEIEPYPVAVTRSRFPNMKHLGSVTEVKGNEIEPVDVITFGSPCQDLSVAGKRAGLKHPENGDEETTRSGLFMEAIRIIKEMREATNGIYPRIAIWENVPGAFSSNKGEDFRVVLEELIKIAEPGAKVPPPDKGKWPYSDVYVGDGWSLAYRTLDAQYWGVPQRRRRIYLVADFRGQCAGKISFERKGLRGYFTESRAQREAVAGDAEGGAGAADRGGELVAFTLKIRSGCAVDSAGKAAGKGALIQTNKAATLAVAQDQYLFQPVMSAGFKAGQGVNARSIGWEEERCPTLAAEAGGNSVPSVCVKEQHLFENHSQDARYRGPLDVCPMLPAQLGTGGNNQPFVVESKVYESHPMDSRIKELDGVAPTVSRKWHKGAADTPLVCEGRPVYCLQGNGIDRADTAGCNGAGWREGASYTLNTIDRPAVAYAVGNGQLNQISMSQVGNTLDCMHDKQAVLVEDVAGVDCRNFTEHPELYPTLQAKPNGGQSLNFSGAVRVRYIVRRLTPTECARLQGFPDKWGHIDQKTDFTDEEYAFWLNVRNTHAAINGKATKDYTRDQMLTWYNKLQTDSSEYKMWGNGIALPCALYVMQGIAEVLYESRN